MNPSWSRRAHRSFLIGAPLFVFALALALARRFTPETALSGDLTRYQQIYESAYFMGYSEYIASYRFELGFSVLFKFFQDMGLTFSQYLDLNQLAFFTAFYYLLRAVTPHSYTWAGAALIGSLFLPTHLLMSNQALRQAWAMTLLFIALGILLRRLRTQSARQALLSPWVLVPLLLGVLFHASLIAIVVLIVAALTLPQRLLLPAWLVMFGLYCTNFVGLGGYLEQYLYPIINARSTGVEAQLETGYTTGRKLSYILMSVVPFLAWQWVRMFRVPISAPLQALFNIYWVANAFCLLLIYLPFSDRFFHYSWSIIPVIAAGVLYAHAHSRYASAASRRDQSMRPQRRQHSV